MLSLLLCLPALGGAPTITGVGEARRLIDGGGTWARLIPRTP